MCRMKALLGKSCCVYSSVLRQGEIKTEACRSTMMLLTIEGSCSFSLNGSGFVLLEPGSITLFPEKSCYVITAHEDTRLLNYCIENIMNFWDGPFPDRNYGGDHDSEMQYPCILKMNPRLRKYVEAMSWDLDEGLSDERFMNMKSFELIHLLQFYYSQKMLFDFLYPVVNENGAFTRLVLDNWETARNKDELAALTGLSPSRFGVKFKEVFGTSPYKWMMARRSEKILYRLVYTEDSLRRIREDMHFGSAQHFNDFCKKQFGNAPGRIRSVNRKEREENKTA